MSTSHYYEHANPLFVRRVVKHGRSPTVLDVGCWNGTLGRQLIRSCGAVVDGIERDPKQAEHAKLAGYRHIHVADLDQPLEFHQTEQYDFVLFGDILEHLVRPQQVLRSLSGLAKKTGVVLVSLPNIAFIANRLTHLAGNWNYKDYGTWTVPI